MKLVWSISEVDAQKVCNFVESWRNNRFVQERVARNTPRRRVTITKEQVWKAMLCALATTRQRSGPGTKVHMFITADPFPLGYGDCRGLDDLCAHIQAVLQDYRLRRSTKIAIEGAKNFAILESDRWSRLDATLARLPTDDEPDAERTAADFLAETFHGIGPKQSRNLLQDLGLTRFEIPIDSRIARWLNAFGFPVRINAATLADPNYYAFVSRGVQELCRAAGVLPCVLDAAVFASYDGEKWNDPAVKI